jgi:hypothetical protein
VNVSWSLPFHIVFIESLDKNDYLIVVQRISNRSSIIRKTLNSSDRCLNINELFNETILKYSPLRRIKYYHLITMSNKFIGVTTIFI